MLKFSFISQHVLGSVLRVAQTGNAANVLRDTVFLAPPALVRQSLMIDQTHEILELCSLFLEVLPVECTEGLLLGLPLPPTQCPISKASGASIPLEKILPPILIFSALAAILGFIFWKRLRRRTTHLQERLVSTEQDFELVYHELSSLRKVWEIDWTDIRPGLVIGSGAFGRVVRAEWRGMDVAVKMLSCAYLESDQMKEEMDREATMLQTLRHAHVVQFLGAGTNDEGVPFLVTELMELGALTEILARQPGKVTLSPLVTLIFVRIARLSCTAEGLDHQTPVCQ